MIFRGNNRKKCKTPAYARHISFDGLKTNKLIE